MRIIAGEKRGCHIESPIGKNTRPTLDRVRESIFGIIQFELENKTVLDMFAGSGAMGLEALSRGARFAAFCDSSHESAQVIRTNIAKLGFQRCTQVYECDFRVAVQHLKRLDSSFDLVFLDPPYEYGLADVAIKVLMDEKALSQDFMVIVEHSLKLPPQLPDGLVIKSSRHYGGVGVSIIVEGADT
ncbi:MAG: 16S rRNA (guanine(966)-N(2))-methyltransferase RsmD [Clostridia bacterium]